ncbi:DUF2947 domain-containing protein [Paraferrimonas sp. SM1919]|uniref:DUF2947 domain-containing protein n=1 Tax=Paraferrimonas sp. SM1919 TaxID=2662263 RepID=UPI0013D3CB2A|nr:DUF2947 domain-containing protein [Paraferrimonas sp. SM1919]
MNYIALEDYKKAWIFRHQELPISEDDKAQIKPMSATRSTQLWKERISKQSDHPDFFKKGDWAFEIETWQEQGEWESIFDSADTALPELILESIEWQDNTVVYYCCDQNNVIESNWGVFKRCWKNFLFMDDGVLLIAKKRNEVVQFLSNGSFQIGKINQQN